MTLEAKPAAGGEPKVPAYSGGQMPLSTFLPMECALCWPSRRNGVAAAGCAASGSTFRPGFPPFPAADRLLVEHSSNSASSHGVLHLRGPPREPNARHAHHAAHGAPRPKAAQLSDHRLRPRNFRPVADQPGTCGQFLAPDILGDELEEWILDSPMLKRSFRHVATVTGIVEQQNNAARKTMRQMTVSTDLIYDVLRRYEADHVLLQVTRRDAERELLDLKRLSELLTRFQDRWLFMRLGRAVALLDPGAHRCADGAGAGAGIEHLLAQASIQHEAEEMMEEVRAAVAKTLH